jgi:hypothetical protein
MNVNSSVKISDTFTVDVQLLWRRLRDATTDLEQLR